MGQDRCRQGVTGPAANPWSEDGVVGSAALGSQTFDSSNCARGQGPRPTRGEGEEENIFVKQTVRGFKVFSGSSPLPCPGTASFTKGLSVNYSHQYCTAHSKVAKRVNPKSPQLKKKEEKEKNVVIMYGDGWQLD